jgi:predicted phage terminase large subunit-like protein
VNDSCNRFRVNLLLIEAAGPGISAAQDIQNRFGMQPWGIHLVRPKGDKISRWLSSQPTFAQLLVHAPDRDWSQMVIDEMATAPKGRYDDLTDSASMAINFLRGQGFARTDGEVAAEREEETRPRSRLAALYPC